MERNKLEQKLTDGYKLELFFFEGELVAELKGEGYMKEGNGTTTEKALNDLEDELNSVNILPRKNK